MRTRWSAAILTAALLFGSAASASAAPMASGSAAAKTLPFEIFGKTYSDFSWKNAVDEGQSKTRADSGTGFDLKRFYLGASYRLSPVFSAHFLTDVGDQAKHFDVFVKNAYIQAKLMPALIVRAGVANNPWFPYAEDRYGMRFVENTLVDRLGYGSSADWGLHVLGDFANGMLGYQVSIVNGNGYANPTRAQVPSVEARVNAQFAGHLYVALGGAASQLGQNTAETSKLKLHTGTREDLLVAWDAPTLRVGLEGFLAHDYTAKEVTGAEDTARGATVYASWRFLPALSVFGRFDYAQPDADTDASVRDTYYNAGVDYSPFSFWDLALVYKGETVDSGSALPGTLQGTVLATSNGPIGSAVPDQTGTYQEVGLFTQLSF